MAALTYASISSKLCCQAPRSLDVRQLGFGASQPCGLRCNSRVGLRLQVNGRREVLAFARMGPPRTGRKRSGPGSKPPSRRTQKTRREEDDEDAAAEAALEELFRQLEKDLGSGSEDDDDDDDEEITEEEVAAFERELEAALMGIDVSDDEGDEEGDEDEGEDVNGEPGLVDMVMRDGVYGQAVGGAGRSARAEEGEEEEDSEDEVEDDDDENQDEQRTVPLEKWQLRKLAAAAEKGRRNVNVKALAADLGMDRADVLSFLRNPPPELLLMSASLDEESAERTASSKLAEASGRMKPPKVVTPEKREPELKPATAGGPQGPKSWHSNKRLRKEHIATFERVYRQSQRPSNAMIQNLVLLTHVPRKKIVQWFDDQRLKNEPKKSSFQDAPEA